MKYRIGLDIGIGSVGWAVVSAEQDGHPARIEDFGVRIFPSGEKEDRKGETLCKERRGFRGVRRLERRRANRKKLLFNHLKNIGFIGDLFNDEYAACRDSDVYALKVRALDGRLTPAEVYKCLVHTCNHRGYQDFYEPEEDDEESGKNAGAANAFEKAFLQSGKRTVSEYLISDYYSGGFVKYRNRKEAETYLLIRRKLLKDEAYSILRSQARFYPCLTEANIQYAVDKIIFRQRDFEDGPGDPNDPDRRYKGFLEKLGQCPFYRDQTRGFRGTVIADVFAVTNALSQYRYVNESTGEYKLPQEAAEEMVQSLLLNAGITLTGVKAILKKYGYKLLKSENTDDKAVGRAVRFLGVARKATEEAGLSWREVISEEQFDPASPSLLHRIGERLSGYQTPSRRQIELEKAGIAPALIKTFASKKISGTAGASYAYMCDAIRAFRDGDIYGNFQANRNRDEEESSPAVRTKKLSPAQIDDPDVRNNRVVFKAINETRKIVNAVIDVYGSPESIVIEVASELGKSGEMRQEIQRRMRKNEKANDAIREKIAGLLSVAPEEVKGVMIERCKLFEEQDGRCAYSGEPLGELRDVLENRNGAYEIDHIIPYSLILDNTLENKALVFKKENQEKGQRTPLMYMSGEKQERFTAFVNRLYYRKENPISKKKLAYYNQKDICGEDAKKILSEWKSRNINDTRYITKYIAGLLDRNLLFSGEKKQNVFTVKGPVTQKFRREWFRDSRWGSEEKDRSTYLNHALDALIAANLTKEYIEIGSDALRLRAILRANKNARTREYDEYLEKCIEKMKKYYGFGEEYTRTLLTQRGRVPSYLPRLTEEVSVRFEEGDGQAFAERVEKLYGRETPFLVPPHLPLASLKQERKYSGPIADSNPLKIVEIGGEPHKIKRKEITALTAKDLEKLYTDDPALKEELEKALGGRGEAYSMEKYLKENGLSRFTLSNGTVIRRVSLDGGVVSNFYKKEIGDGNYTNLGMLKYYCVEVYRDKDGKTRVCGVRFVDLVKEGKKLKRKPESLPADYGTHTMYLFANDYITVQNGKGVVKYRGYYKSVANIKQSKFCYSADNESRIQIATISGKDTVKKIHIDILGKRGGEIRCSEPLPFTEGKNSR